MWPMRSFVRAVLSASLLSTPPLTLGVLGERSIAIAGGNVLQELRSVTDEMLKQPGSGGLADEAGRLSSLGLQRARPNTG